MNCETSTIAPKCERMEGLRSALLKSGHLYRESYAISHVRSQVLSPSPTAPFIFKKPKDIHQRTTVKYARTQSVPWHTWFGMGAAVALRLEKQASIWRVAGSNPTAEEGKKYGGSEPAGATYLSNLMCVCVSRGLDKMSIL